jgi:hypothetical protein
MASREREGLWGPLKVYPKCGQPEVPNVVIPKGIGRVHFYGPSSRFLWEFRGFLEPHSNTTKVHHHILCWVRL